MSKFVDFFPVQADSGDTLSGLSDTDVTTVTLANDQLLRYDGVQWVNDISIGTGPNNILQLDGSGNLPPLDGSALTNLTVNLSGNDLSDFAITSPSTNDFLIYDGANFVNQQYTPDPSVIINTQTGSVYQLVTADNGKIIEFTNASNVTVTVPLEATLNLGAGFNCVLAAIGAGQVTVVGEGAVVLNSKDGNLKLSGQYSTATLYRRAPDEFLLAGDLSA